MCCGRICRSSMHDAQLHHHAVARAPNCACGIRLATHSVLPWTFRSIVFSLCFLASASHKKQRCRNQLSDPAVFHKYSNLEATPFFFTHPRKRAAKKYVWSPITESIDIPGTSQVAAKESYTRGFHKTIEGLCLSRSSIRTCTEGERLRPTACSGQSLSEHMCVTDAGACMLKRQANAKSQAHF
jgi:hypothetical protein